MTSHVLLSVCHERPLRSALGTAGARLGGRRRACLWAELLVQRRPRPRSDSPEPGAARTRVSSFLKKKKESELLRPASAVAPPCSRLLRRSLRVWLLVVNGRERQRPTPHTSSQPPAPGKVFAPNIPSGGCRVCLRPVSSKDSSQKYLYDFTLSSFFFLLKIVLRVLASVDIKITVMCKTRTRKRLIRV